MLTDKAGRLTGLFTDSDLARLFEKRDEAALDRPMCTVMVAQPTTVPSGTRLGDAVALLAQRKFSELPVVDKKGRPLGLVDVTDVLGLKTEAEADVPSAVAEESGVSGAKPQAVGCASLIEHMSLTETCSKIELILSDVDGVMTDGGIHILDDGQQIVKFHIRDGMGVRLWREAGKRFGIVTGRKLESIRRRAADLWLDIVRLGIDDKLPEVDALAAELGLQARAGLLHRRRFVGFGDDSRGGFWRRGGGCGRRRAPRGKIHDQRSRRTGGGSRSRGVDPEKHRPLGRCAEALRWNQLTVI